MDNCRTTKEIFLGRIGINLCWGKDLSSEKLEVTLKNIKEKGYNIARVWLCRWGIRGLWHDDYIPAQPESTCDLGNLDLVLNLSRKLDIKIIITIIPHAHFLANSKYEVENPIDGWLGNPFRENNNTPCSFFYDQQIRKYFHNFLTYLYDYFSINSPPFAVELCNEIDMIYGLSNHLIVDWHKQTLMFCKKLNPKILLTTSTAIPDSIPELLALEYLDAISLHNYRFPYSSAIANLHYWKKKLSHFGKPIWVTEFDFNSQKAERDGIALSYLQSAILASPCLRYEVGSCFWWWEETLEHDFMPKLILDVVFEWLHCNADNSLFNKLFATKKIDIRDYNRTQKIKMANFIGKNFRYLSKKIHHKIMSYFDNSIEYGLVLKSGKNFLILIEASEDNPTHVTLQQDVSLRGICYNISHSNGAFEATNVDLKLNSCWTTKCVQVLLLQEN
jgi:hypothetical protein